MARRAVKRAGARRPSALGQSGKGRCAASTSARSGARLDVLRRLSALLRDQSDKPAARAAEPSLDFDRADREGTAVTDRFSHRDKTLGGVPSVAALEALLEAYDFRIERFSDWGSLVRDNRSFDAGGYSWGRRVTARCISKI
jgi:hypothetical protein